MSYEWPRLRNPRKRLRKSWKIVKNHEKSWKNVKIREKQRLRTAYAPPTQRLRTAHALLYPYKGVGIGLGV